MIMKKLLILVLSLGAISAMAQTPAAAPATLRSVLVEQLKTTHTRKDWFVPVNIALEGLTPEQAMWKEGKDNHSVGQLANHLLFWNSRVLANFKGEKNAAFDGNNDETFNAFDKTNWAETVKKLDKVLTDIENLVQTADEAKLKEWAPTVANISTHNAYHTGQIIYVRKLQGAWDPEKGTK
jgi:uncharacterized damage-inducible protein DinB